MFNMTTTFALLVCLNFEDGGGSWASKQASNHSLKDAPA
jgi:hypothetical protein